MRSRCQAPHDLVQAFPLEIKDLYICLGHDERVMKLNWTLLWWASLRGKWPPAVLEGDPTIKPIGEVSF